MEPEKPNIKQVVEGIKRILFGYEVAAFEELDPIAHLLMEDPKKAIPQIRAVWNRAVDKAYGPNRAIVNAYAGGPIETLNYLLYNAVGAAYPYLDRETKDEALSQILEILDGINNFYVQASHTNGIREPLLLGDICVCREQYWPGYKWETSEVGKYQEFAALRAERMDEQGLFSPRAVRSDFLMACAILFTQECQFREEYVRAANPRFLEKVVRAIVAVDLCGTPPERLEKELAKVETSFPPPLRDRVRIYHSEGGWVDRTKFGRDRYWRYDESPSAK